MAQNPYTTPPDNAGHAPGRVQGVWNGPGRYAVPDIYETTDPDYTLGFSPKLMAGGSRTGAALPDAIRTEHQQPVVGSTYNEPWWVQRRFGEKEQRYTADVYSTANDPAKVVKQEKIPAPNVPIWQQERMPTRPTATMAPASYYMQRPWYIPRNVVDALTSTQTDYGASRLHFSMADHKRKYAISLLTPQGRVGVNTYRAEPRPWDENLFHQPPAGRTPTGIAGNGAYRLVG